MSDKVFILGAGFNQGIKNGNNISPPLSNNFFSLLQQTSKYESSYKNDLEEVYKFIQEYWKLSETELLNRRFNLEDFFTVIQLKIDEAHRMGNHDRANDLIKLRYDLIVVFINFLRDFEHYHSRYEIYRDFGQHILNEKPNIILFK